MIPSQPIPNPLPPPPPDDDVEEQEKTKRLQALFNCLSDLIQGIVTSVLAFKSRQKK